MVNANDFKAQTDNETIEKAIAARDADGIVVIPPRVSDTEPDRDFWLLDRAVLLPANTILILRSCKLKLSDLCRDNFFRTANCGMGIDYPERISNVHIKGEGLVTLAGADHPRASGDSSKILSFPCPYTDSDLCAIAPWIPEDRRAAGKPSFDDKHSHSYGTDAGKENESQYGDWRGIGILFANTENFSIENLRIVESHGWGISLEECANGTVRQIEFDARMSKMIDGMLHNMENQDGINLRNGCHNIVVSDVRGQTGDDVIALTAIKDSEHKGGILNSTQVMHSEWDKRESGIHDVIIRNITAYSNLCYNVRLLACDTEIKNVVIDGVIDTSPKGHRHRGAIIIGDPDGAYGKNHPHCVSNIAISNVICNSDFAIRVKGYLSDSTITGIVNQNKDCPVISIERVNALSNVTTSAITTAGKDIFANNF